MKKYYCDRCRLLYSEVCACTGCGSLELKEIWIEVQQQSNESN